MRRPPAVDRARFGWVLAGAALAAAYMILAGAGGAAELAASAVGACGALLWTATVVSCSPKALQFTPASAAPLVRSLLSLPWKTVTVAQTLATVPKGEEGRTEPRLMTRGRDDDPIATGRRAIEVLAASLAPDSFVVRLPESRDVRIDHVLGPHAPPRGGGP